MNIAKAPELILAAMKEHEQALAGLYEVYAGKFPEYKKFWTKLALEEVMHAGWIDKLHADIEGSSEDFVIERFRIGALEHSTDYVKKQAETALQPDFVLINALSIALRLEEALIENKYFEVFEGDSPKTKHSLTLLAQSTQIHCERIRRAWQEHR